MVRYPLFEVQAADDDIWTGFTGDDADFAARQKAQDELFARTGWTRAAYLAALVVVIDEVKA